MSTRSKSAMRGVVAAGAATAVLLGGFGVFALWSDAANIGETGEISTGNLALSEAAPGSWEYERGNGSGDWVAISDVNDFVASPGDVLRYESKLSGGIKGSDITARLVGSLPEPFANAALADDVNVTVVDTSGYPVEITDTTGKGAFLGGSEGAELTVAVQIEFDPDMSAAATMNVMDAVTLDGFGFKLQQVGAPD